MRRALLIFGLSAVFAGAAQALPSNAHAPAKGVAVAPSADAYVSAAARRRNFGRAKVLRVQSRPIARSYLRFKLTGLANGVERATLRLFVRTGSRRGFRVQVSGSAWSERRITFANAPRPSGTAVAMGAVRSRRWVSVDVTRLVRGNGILSVALTGSGRGLSLASRESGARRPQIVIVSKPPPVLLAAGDIAWCGGTGDEATAAIVNSFPGAIVAAVGDLAYDSGSLAEFNACYQPSWGAFKTRTHPVPGNHEYQTPQAAGYFAYWGAAAGDPTQGWYSYDLGAWHIVALNSSCVSVGGCQPGSPQYGWLVADLAAHRTTCTLAYWHHPLFSGTAGTSEAEMAPLWEALYDNNADLILTAHAHNYQRFAPQTAQGVADPTRGIREFVVGTGGRSTQPAMAIANTEVLNSVTFGVLDLTLRRDRYDWKFRPIAGQTFVDSGSQACH